MTLWRTQHYWKSFQRLSQDTIVLGQSLWKASDAAQRRSVLLQSARNNNNHLARQFFKIEHVVNTIQYYGILHFMKQSKLWQRVLGPLVDTTNWSSGDATVQNGTTRNHARVAFMIPLQKREELLELGYSPTQIKSMSPQTAHNILLNGTSTTTRDNNEPFLVRSSDTVSTEPQHSANSTAPPTHSVADVPTVSSAGTGNSTTSVASLTTTRSSTSTIPTKTSTGSVKDRVTNHSKDSSHATILASSSASDPPNSSLLDATPSSNAEGALGQGGQDETDSKTTTDASTERPPSDTTASAKIPFMITAAMRGELIAMGYCNTSIKHMTPIQAAAVLENTVLPIDFDTQVPAILNRQQTKQQQQEAIPTSTATTETIPVGTATQIVEPLPKLAPHQTLWFQVVQRNSKDASESVVGLYRNENEAQFCQETYEELAARKPSSLVYFIRPVAKD